MEARNGNFATCKIVSATSSGSKACAKTSGDGLTGLFLQQFGIDQPRADHGGSDAVLFLFHANCVSHAENSALGRLIGGAGHIGESVR